MDYQTLQKMNRFAKFWDLYANSGQFKAFMSWFISTTENKSFFWSFFTFNEFLSERFTETHSLSLVSLAEQAWHYLKRNNVDDETAAAIIEKDYCHGFKRRDVPVFLKPQIKIETASGSRNHRQLQHLT